MKAQKNTPPQEQIKVRRHYDELGRVQATVVFTDKEIKKIYDGDVKTKFDR